MARTLLQRYPEPTRPGTANNFDRTADETVDQDQFGVRVDHGVTARGDRVFGRLTLFREHFVPVAPLPEGSGTTTGTLGPQRTRSWAWASSYQRPISGTLLNEVPRTVLRRLPEKRNGPAAPARF